MSATLDRRSPFPAVLDVLARQDPEELIAIGAPEDEYAPEADDFARRLRTDQPISGRVVAEVWERWFGSVSSYLRSATPQDLDALAAELNATTINAPRQAE